MNTILLILIIAYFAVNVFLSGRIYEKDVMYANNPNDKIVAWSMIFLFILFGSIFQLAAVFISVWLFIWNKINKYTQISFFFHYWLTKKYHNVSHKNLYKINVKARKSHNADTYTGWLLMYCLDMINKRNNYTFKPE